MYLASLANKRNDSEGKNKKKLNYNQSLCLVNITNDG